MKNVNFLAVMLLSFMSVSMGLLSCSEDTMQEINRNKNNPPDMASKFIITDVINNTAFTITGTDYAFYASVYVEYNVGIWGQMYNAEIRTAEPTSATTYNNSWGSSYNNLWNLKTILEKCSPGGEEEIQTTILGMAQVLTAYNLAMLTDLMGDVPWTEALQPGVIFTPALDKQSDLYEVINGLIADAIKNFEDELALPDAKRPESIDDQDPLFGGDTESWLQFAYGLKARYAMRLSKIKPNYDAVIAAAENSFTKKSEEAYFKCGSSGINNPFFVFFRQRDYFGASQSLHDKLEARNDPRDDKFFRPYPGGDEVIFAPNGAPRQIQKYYGTSAQSTALVGAPVYLMSYHELEFLKAEAYARKNDLVNAATHLKNALTTCFTNVGLKVDQADEYYESDVEPKLANQTDALKEILTQKYFGLFEGEAIETYNDIRRLKAMGEGSTISLANTKQFPLRYSYGADDVTTNVNVRNAYGNGDYVYTENVWWAGGSR